MPSCIEIQGWEQTVNVRPVIPLAYTVCLPMGVSENLGYLILGSL